MANPPFDVQVAHRWFAVECNNRSWDLIEAEQHSSAEREELLHTAHAAYFHWNACGTDLNKLRAMTLLAMAYQVVNVSERACEYTSQGLDLLEKTIEGVTDFDTACVYAIGCLAYAGVDSETSLKHRQRAIKLSQKLTDADEKALFNQLFPTVK